MLMMKLWLVLGASTALAANPEGMVRIPAGTFTMGCGDECPMQDAKPLHTVSLDGFWMDETPITNEAFASFVAKTGYVTIAERAPNPAEYPEVPADKLRAGSAVFTPADVSLRDPYKWWRFTPGAFWRRPDGPVSYDALLERPKHPVVHVAWDDALAYCHWADKDLPSEAQFEYAARGGLERKKYAWGDELKPGGKWVANIFQGHFPKQDIGKDGYKGTSPVTAFPKNGYGLFDVAGNVWEWCKDWYRPDTYARQGARQTHNPQGPKTSEDPSEPGTKKRVQRGGSYLCSDQYCIRYLVASRGRGTPDSSASNLGFRCVRN